MIRYVVALVDRRGVTKSKHSTHETFEAASAACVAAQDFCDRWRPQWRAAVKKDHGA